MKEKCEVTADLNRYLSEQEARGDVDAEISRQDFIEENQPLVQHRIMMWLMGKDFDVDMMRAISDSRDEFISLFLLGAAHFGVKRDASRLDMRDAYDAADVALKFVSAVCSALYSQAETEVVKQLIAEEAGL